MKNLCCLCPNLTDATSFYRGVGVLSEVRKQIPNLSLGIIEQINWASISLFDAFFIQRGFTGAHLKVAEMVKRQNLPLWVDYDDDLFNVPVWNPVHKHYNTETVKYNLANIIALADVVTVSTEHLKKRFDKLNKNIIVVNNAVNLNLLEAKQDKTNVVSRVPTIFWRGSKTHEVDLDSVAEAVIEISNTMPSHWVFLGDNPWFTRKMPQKAVTICEALDPIEYFQFLNKAKFDIQIIPLADIDFNHSKSNCGWLEGSYADATVLAPDWEEWRKPGIVNYSTPAVFKDKLIDLITDIPTANSKASWNYILENLTLEKVNEKRIDILNKLLV